MSTPPPPTVERVTKQPTPYTKNIVYLLDHAIDGHLHANPLVLVGALMFSEDQPLPPAVCLHLAAAH